MSKQVTVTKVCDVPDERRGEHAAHRTVRFGIDGKAWEKDVCGPHDREMAYAIAPFIRAARPAGKRSPARHRPSATRRHAAAIRAWAKEQGLTDKDRGRVAASVVAKYEAAHRGRR